MQQLVYISFDCDSSRVDDYVMCTTGSQYTVLTRRPLHCRKVFLKTSCQVASSYQLSIAV